MTIQIDHAQSDDAPAVVTMIDELLHEIMADVNDKALGWFHQDETTARAPDWVKDGKYTVSPALDGSPQAPSGSWH